MFVFGELWCVRFRSTGNWSHQTANNCVSPKRIENRDDREKEIWFFSHFISTSIIRRIATNRRFQLFWQMEETYSFYPPKPTLRFRATRAIDWPAKNLTWREMKESICKNKELVSDFITNHITANMFLLLEIINKFQ